MNNIEILEHIAIAYIDDEEFSQYVSPEGRFITNKQLAQALENLIQEYKELKENQIWSEATIEGLKKDFVPAAKLKEIIYPTPENPIPFEVQSSEMYKKLEKLVEGE